MSLAILRAMTSTEYSMGLRSFLTHDEPLNAGRLKLSDGRLCEELEIKSLMKSSPLTHSSANTYSKQHNGTNGGSITNGSVVSKQHHTYDYAATNSGESVSSTTSNTTSSSSVCSGHRRRSITNNNNSSCVNCGQQKQVPSRTPSTASTSLSSNGTLLHTTSGSSTFRQQKQQLVSQQHKGNHVEYTEPTILVTQSHLHQQQHIETHGVASPNLTSAVQPNPIQRCDSSNSVAADHEICPTLRHRSRTQTSEEEMADEDELLEAGKIHNNDRLIDDFEHVHLNGSLTRRRILPQAINKDQILNYIANTSALYIKRSGTELQVTDSTGFPLLDVWQKRNCFQTTWVLESYGRTVLLLHSVGRSWKLWANRTRKSMPVLEVESADRELLGFFVVADPFIVQNRERAVVARFNSFDSGEGRTMLHQCLLECSGEEIGRLEPRKAQLSQLRFGQLGTSFPLKLLVLAAAVRIAALLPPNNQSNHSVSPNTRRPVKRRNKSSCCSIV